MTNTEPKTKFNTSVMKFGRYDTGTPVVFEYFGSNKWIDFGIKNDYPQELLRLYNNASPLHKSLINRKADIIAGKGFNAETPFIMNEFSKDTLNTVVKKCALDYVIFNGFYLNLLWSPDGKEVTQIEFLPYEKMRIAKTDADRKNNSEQLEGFYMSKNWLARTRVENKPKFYVDYEQEWDKFFDDNYRPTANEIDEAKIAFRIAYPSQIMFVKGYTPGMDYYTLPTYSAALNDIKLSYEISTYHLKNVQNGLMPGMVIVQKSGIPTDEEKEADYENIRQSYGGADNAGDFIMLYAESKDTAPDFIPVQLNSSDQRFRDLRIQIADTIKQTHLFTSAIAGIETSGKLGGSSEIEEQLQYMQATAIDALQFEIDAAFNKILKMNGSTEKVKLNKYTIYNLANVTDPVIQTNKQIN